MSVYFILNFILLRTISFIFAGLLYNFAVRANVVDVVLSLSAIYLNQKLAIVTTTTKTTRATL